MRSRISLGRGNMRHLGWLLAAACILFMALPAQARPRDDALAGAFRCAVIGDARQWLECYYGAAQPVRAGLSLAPALPAQVKLASAPPAGGTATLVPARDEAMAQAAACMRITAERAWLNCYYDAAAAVRGQLGLSVPVQAARPAPPPRPQLASLPPAPSGPPPMPRNGGLFKGLFEDAKPVVRNLPAKSYEFGKSGRFTLTLADGEVWMQSPEDEVYHPARWRRPAESMRVTIVPDAMNTFTMSVAGESKIYKVRRIH